MPSRQELTDAILAIKKRNSPPLSTLKKPELAALLAKLQGGAETPKAKDMPAPAAARAKFYQEALDERKKMDDNIDRLVDIANNIIEANKDEIEQPDSEWLEYNFANSFEAILKQQEGMNSKEIIKSMKDISSKFRRGGDTRLSIDTWLEENDVTPEQKAEKIETRRKEKEDYQALLDREIVKIEERNITSQNIALDKLKQRKIDLEDEIATAIINLHISTTNLERLREIRDAKKK